MAGFLITLKVLPSTYTKDLQENNLKEPLFDAVDTIGASLKIAEGVIATMTVHAEKMLAVSTIDVLATDLADYFVRKGVTVSRDASRLGTRGGIGRGASMPARRTLGARLQAAGVVERKAVY